MTDKNKIRKEVQRLMNELIQEKEKGFGSDADDACILELQNVLTFIDSLQEEPVSSIWHNASEKSNKPENVVIINPFDNTGEVLTKCVDVYQGHIWAYTSELLKLYNLCKVGKNLQEEPVSEELEKTIDTFLATYFGSEKEKQEWPFLKKMAIYFAKWQKQKDSIPVSKELSEYINELSKQFPEVSFAKLSRIAVRVAKWQKEQIIKMLLKHIESLEP